MILRCALLVSAFAASLAAAEPRLPKLFLIGGSTMATFPPERPVVGWGQKLPELFQNAAQVDNRARSGRSSKSFIDQGLWAGVINDIRAGDFLIVCFGTNDAASDSARHTAPRGEFAENLKRFIAETRAKGATPMLATSVAHRRWDAHGRWAETASEYVIVTREIAAAERVPLLEMFERTAALEKSLGAEGSKALHLYLPPGRYDSYPNGAHDDTHFCADGARRVAELAVEEIRRLKLPLVEWLR